MTQVDSAAGLEPRALQSGHCCWQCGPSWTLNANADMPWGQRPLWIPALFSSHCEQLSPPPWHLWVTLLDAEAGAGASRWPSGGPMPTQQQSARHTWPGHPPRCTRFGDPSLKELCSESQPARPPNDVHCCVATES